MDLSRFDPQRLKEKGIAVRNFLRIPSDAVIVGFVGRLRRDKGINELIQAFLDLHEKYPRLYLLPPNTSYQTTGPPGRMALNAS